MKIPINFQNKVFFPEKKRKKKFLFVIKISMKRNAPVNTGRSKVLYCFGKSKVLRACVCVSVV